MGAFGVATWVLMEETITTTIFVFSDDLLEGHARGSSRGHPPAHERCGSGHHRALRGALFRRQPGAGASLSLLQWHDSKDAGKEPLLSPSARSGRAFGDALSALGRQEGTECAQPLCSGVAFQWRSATTFASGALGLSKARPFAAKLSASGATSTACACM